MQKKLPQLYFSTKHIIKHQKRWVFWCKSMHNFFLGRERGQEPHVIHCYNVLLGSNRILLKRGVARESEQPEKKISAFTPTFFALEEDPTASQMKNSFFWPTPLISICQQVLFSSKNWPLGQFFVVSYSFSSSFFLSVDWPTILPPLEHWNLWHKEVVIV